MAHRAGRLTALIVASAVLFAAPAYAIDGEVLIDQAKANAGRVTRGDAPGFPVTISRRGKYKLSGNLTVARGKGGILVTAPDVTIDLNGFAIIGHSSGQSQSGVQAADRDNLTVMNGTISRFGQNGVETFGRFAIIEALRVDGAKQGLQLGNDARVVGSTITGNRDVGIRCGLRCLIAQNVISQNGGDGVQLRDGGMALGNTITGNRILGILGDSIGFVGFGDNALFGNNSNGATPPVFGPQVQAVTALHPNACSPPCP